MSVPPKVTPFAYDENYSAGADPWAATATKKASATRNSGFKPKTKIPAQVVNYELNVAQTANEATRKALALSALQGGRSIRESDVYTSASDRLSGAFFSSYGGLILPIGVNNRVYRSLPASGTALVTSTGSFTTELYGAEDSEEFFDGSDRYTAVVNGTTGGVYEYHVEADSVSTIVPTAGGRSFGRIIRKRGTFDYWILRRITAGTLVEIFTSTAGAGGSASVTVGAGFTWPTSATVSIDWDPISGETWLTAESVGTLSAGTFSVSDTGITAGYVSRGLTWSPSDNVFYCITTEASSTVLYKRAPGAATWTKVCTFTSAISGSGSLWSPLTFEAEGLEDFGGLLVTCGGSSLAAKSVMVSDDGGFTWSSVAAPTTSGASDHWRFKRSWDSGALALFPSGATITNTSNPAIWVSNCLGVGEGIVRGI